MPSDKLNDAAIRKAVPGDKPRKLTDGGGLYLELRPNGARWWRIKYRHAGKENRLSLGTYPDVTLAEARRRREAVRAQLAAGVDPAAVRKADRAELAADAHAQQLEDAGLPPVGSFEHVARDWLRLVHEPKVSAGYAKRSRIQLEADVFPIIGRLPVASVTAPMLLDLLRRIEARGALDTAHRVKQTCGLVFRYAIATGHAERDPVPDLRGALAAPVTQHYASTADPRMIGELLRAFHDYGGHPATRTALLLGALTFQRPGNVLAMRWADVDLDGALWSIPSADMKRTKQGKVSGKPHLVPLARQAVELLRALHPLTGAGLYCFPNQRSRDRPISNVTMNAAMRRMGFSADEMTAHGFRAMARTAMVENLPGIDPEWIEAQLAHGKAGPLGSAYDRAQYLPQRRQMMQTWADWLERLRAGATVVQFQAA
ncbi:MAG TPA: integrase arm-type DNA-binding domain-containing protein [Aquabacterium sp.]|nr:integrase arm-type DNA-binding domain-containing protein [Aquabacterium sp.]HQC94589.1 integrase arm-type DNA-binding domain-containing protein [Aquabacterium sp.]